MKTLLGPKAKENTTNNCTKIRVNNQFSFIFDAFICGSEGMGKSFRVDKIGNDFIQKLRMIHCPFIFNLD